MSTKLNVPSTYFWEAGKYKELEYVVKTSSGAYNETSTTSLVVYSGNDGTQGLFDKLAVALASYIVSATDFNAKWDYPNIQTTQTPSISYGQNLITNSDIADAYPDITFQGQSYVNLLGADGNCEDVSKWSASVATIALDTSKKVFGANAIKITITGTLGSAFKTLSNISSFDPTKYYMLSAYLDKGTASSIIVMKDTTGGGTQRSATSVAITPTRSATKFSPSDYVAGNNLGIYVSGTSGQFGYVDGVLLTEITATEYANDSVDVLMARYPYVDSYACLTNPATEVIHDNMVRNGNGEEGVAWIESLQGEPTFTFDSGKFKMVATALSTKRYKIKVSANTDYTLTGTVSGTGSISVYDGGYVTNIRTGIGTFNSGACTEISVVLASTVAGTAYFDSIQLIPGTVAPTAYKSQRREQCVIEGKFATGDVVRLKEGKLEGKVQWKHKVLYGRDYGWEYYTDGAANKTISLTTQSLYGIQLSSVISNGFTLVKYDGKILVESSYVDPFSDKAIVTFDVYNRLFVGISDTDTGWAEAIAPNADEVKAYMNGWKANANNGTRYTSWVSVVDGSAPATNTIAYVSVTVAPLYKGYQLHYQLANPEAVGLSARLKGTMPKLENGMNVVNVDAGLVIGEVANPVYDGATNYYVADNYLTVRNGILSFPNDGIKSILKSDVYNTNLWSLQEIANSQGKHAAVIPSASFDPKAQYAIDYTILRTDAPVVGTPSMTYTPGVTKKINPDIEPIRMIDSPVTPSPDDLMEGDIVTVWGTSPVVVKRKRLNGLV